MLKMFLLFILYLLASDRLSVYRDLVTVKNPEAGSGARNFTNEDNKARIDTATADQYGGFGTGTSIIDTGLKVYDAFMNRKEGQSVMSAVTEQANTTNSSSVSGAGNGN